MGKVAIIGGTGIGSLLDDLEERAIETRYSVQGEVRQREIPYKIGEVSGRVAIYLNYSGLKPGGSPGLVNGELQELQLPCILGPVLGLAL